VAYFVVNTGLVAFAVTLDRGRSFLATWRRASPWTAASTFTALTLSVCLLAALERFGPWSLALSLPPTWLLVSTYRHYRARLEEQARRIEEVEGLNRRLEQTVSELNGALAHIRRLQGLLPICMHCKSIRDDQDTWHRIESYLAEHAEMQFTHGLCDACREEHYPKTVTT
jgi:hypothetical protein